MMDVFFTKPGSIEPLLVSIPESVGLFAFGIALVCIAAIVRWLLTRGEERKIEKELRKEAEVR